MKTTREIKEGESAPWYYGFAWVNYTRNTTTVIIMPFNWIAMYLRNFWLMTKEGRNYMRSEVGSVYKRAHLLGEEQGKKELYAELGEALREGMKGLERFIDENKEDKRYFTKRSDE